jgi:fucose permease
MNQLAVKCTLFVNYFIFAILLNSVGIVIFQVQNTYGVTESAASILEGCKDIPIAITSFLIASFIAGFGYKRAMFLAMVGLSLMCLAMPQVPTFWMTKILFVCVGVGFAVIKVSAFSCIGLVTQGPKEHASLMSFLESFFMVGVLFAYFLFSLFVDDANPGSAGWLGVYYVLSALCAMACVLLAFTNFGETPSKAPELEAPGASNFNSMFKLCAKPLVFVFVICAFLYVLVEQSIMTWLPSFNSSELNMSPSLSIQMAGILAASTALGRFLAGIFLKKIHWYPLLLACLSLSALAVIIVLPLTALVGDEAVTSWANAPLAAFVFPMIGLCLAPVYPAINSVILSALPKYQHAPMTGLIVVFSALGGTTGSMITGTLFEIFDGRTAFYCSLIPIAAIVYCLSLFKKHVELNAQSAVVPANS